MSDNFYYNPSQKKKKKSKSKVLVSGQMFKGFLLNITVLSKVFEKLMEICNNFYLFRVYKRIYVYTYILKSVNSNNNRQTKKGLSETFRVPFQPCLRRSDFREKSTQHNNNI